MSNILERWGVTVDELSQAILENGSLRGMVFGYVAEIKLRKLLREHGAVTEMVKDDDHDRKKKGDLRITYKGQEFKLESKSLQTASITQEPGGASVGVAQVDASDRRVVTLPDGSKLETTNLVVGEFDVLAVNCFGFAEEWRFVFARNKDLPRTAYRKYTPAQREHLLATSVRVTWPPSGVFTDDLFGLLDLLIEERQSSDGPRAVTLIEENGATTLAVEE